MMGLTIGSLEHATWKHNSRSSRGRAGKRKFPSSSRRGGCAINKWFRSETAQTGWFDGAATPPLKGGEWAFLKRHLISTPCPASSGRAAPAGRERKTAAGAGHAYSIGRARRRIHNRDKRNS